MFEDDNWDITEDDLIDFNVDNIEENISINNSQTNFIQTNNFNSENSLQCTDITFQNSTIPNIFNNTTNIQKNLKSTKLDNSELHSSIENSLESSGASNVTITNDLRKNLVLNVFQQNQAALMIKPNFKSALKITDHSIETENKLKRKKNVAFIESVHKPNSSKRQCVSIENQSPKQLLNNLNFEDTSHLSKAIEQNLVSKCNSVNTKKSIVLDSLKTPIQKNIKIPQVKQTVIRKFPGPAGLIPDDTNDSEAIDLDTLDENENNRSNKFAELCSQNTKNLFTTGAWQLMMDDLPANFELYNIATIKENAMEYSKNYKKVPYFAGIIQYIDYKPNDPHIILKDLTGKIDAHIHHSICKLYPNALGNNVVVLIKDAGLIVTSKKYVCMIISPKNLISMYSDDARLVETPYLEKLYVKNSE